MHYGYCHGFIVFAWGVIYTVIYVATEKCHKLYKINKKHFVCSLKKHYWFAFQTMAAPKKAFFYDKWDTDQTSKREFSSDGIQNMALDYKINFITILFACTVNLVFQNCASGLQKVRELELHNRAF